MTQETSPAADWYEDPDLPGLLRYWDGHAWTEHRTEPADPTAVVGEPAKAPKAPKAPKPPQEPRPEGEQSFPLVVAGVLGAALGLIMVIAVVVVWFDSYSTGHARGELARDSGIEPRTASEYCEATAEDVTVAGSAAGYWDLPWVLGCQRGLG